MNSTSNYQQMNQDELAVNHIVFPDLQKKLLTDVEKAQSVFVHFDHIQGESESDRHQVFSNLLKAASYFGLNVEKIDFHRQDL